MYQPTELANAVTPTSWFYSLYIHTPSNQNQGDYTSRLETSFLLDSGASISLLNYATYVTVLKLQKYQTKKYTQLFKISDRCKSNRSSYYTLCYCNFIYHKRRRLSSVYYTFCSTRYKVQYPSYTLL